MNHQTLNYWEKITENRWCNNVQIYYTKNIYIESTDDKFAAVCDYFWKEKIKCCLFSKKYINECIASIDHCICKALLKYVYCIILQGDSIVGTYIRILYRGLSFLCNSSWPTNLFSSIIICCCCKPLFEWISCYRSFKYANLDLL